MLSSDWPRSLNYPPPSGAVPRTKESGIYHQDDITSLHIEGGSQGEGLLRTTDHAIRCVEIAEALEAEDLARLTTAIEEAEAHGLIPHAARMRLVLAQRTGDRTHLERARPVLERLGDRRSLRRLEEIAVALSEEGQQKPGKG